MRLQLPWIAACAGAFLVCSPTGLAQLVATKAPVRAPIALAFHESPIVLDPHEHTVSAVAFSPDGKTIATGTGALRLWDATTGRLKSVLADDATRGINGLAFSPDGRRLAVVGAIFGKEVVVWDTATGQIAQQIEDSANGLTVETAEMTYKGKPIVYRVLSAVAFSPDGRILATGSDGVVLRDASSLSTIVTLKQPSKGVKAIAFSPDGKTLLTASEDRKVRLWSVPGGVLEATLDGPTQPLSSIAISPDGKRIVAASSGNRSLLSRETVGYLWSWDKPSGSPRKIEMGSVKVRQVAFASLTSAVVAAGRELVSVDLQDDASRPLRKLSTYADDVLALAVSSDRNQVACGGKDRIVDVLEVSTEKLVQRFPGLPEVISAVATSSDSQRFAVATMDTRFSIRMPGAAAWFAARDKAYFSGDTNKAQMQTSEVRIWSTADGRVQTLLPLPAGQVTAIKFVPQSHQLVVAGWTPGKGGMLSLWDADGSKHVRDLAVQSAEVLSIAVSPDGRTLASGDAEGNFDLWDVQLGVKTRSHKHDHAVAAITFTANGKFVATGDADHTVRVFDGSNGKIVRMLKSRSHIASLEFSPDATLLAAGTRDPGLELWNLRAETPSRTLVATGDHFDAMPGFVAFSPDGKYLVCGGEGKNIAIFDVAKEAVHGALKGHIHVPMAAAFLPDGRLVSGGEERIVRMWDLKLGKYVATWYMLPADAKQNWSDQWIGFTPSGQFAGPANLDRLIGWQVGGEIFLGAEDGKRFRRVESLFASEAK